MDLEDFREPVEVYEAADGNPEPLARRIESGAEMNRWERQAIAAYLRGELVEPKRRRGQKIPSYLVRYTREGLDRQSIRNSVTLVRLYMHKLRENGEHYGRFQKVLDFVADKDGLSSEKIERVVNLYKRSGTLNKNDNLTTAKGVIENYHRWLFTKGRLSNFPKAVTLFERFLFLSGEGSRKED